MNNKIKKILSRISVLLVITQIGSCTVMDAASKTWEVIKDPSIKVGEDKESKSKFALSIYADKKVNINEYSDSDDLDEEKGRKRRKTTQIWKKMMMGCIQQQIYVKIMKTVIHQV